MPDRVPAIKVLLLPKDTNALGTIFGGVILSHIDLASAVEARKHGARRFVTKAMREVEFHAPGLPGRHREFLHGHRTRRAHARSPCVSRSRPSAGAAGQGEPVKVTEAEVVLVALTNAAARRPSLRARRLPRRIRVRPFGVFPRTICEAAHERLAGFPGHQRRVRRGTVRPLSRRTRRRSTPTTRAAFERTAPPDAVATTAGP